MLMIVNDHPMFGDGESFGRYLYAIKRASIPLLRRKSSNGLRRGAHAWGLPCRNGRNSVLRSPLPPRNDL